jgi:hypothetical protein
LRCGSLHNHCRDLRPGYDHLLRNLGGCAGGHSLLISAIPKVLRRRIYCQEGKGVDRGGFITPGSPWENCYCESFNARFRDELLNGEVFYTLREAQILIERWRHHYNTVRPHSALGYRPPAPESMKPIDQRPTMH